MGKSLREAGGKNNQRNMTNFLSGKMQNFFNSFEVIDVLAIIFFVSAMVLKFCGTDGTIDSVIAVVVAFYFGHKIGNTPNANV